MPSQLATARASLTRPGWVDVFATEAEMAAMTAAAAEPASLVGATLRALTTFFDAQGHRPSAGHWAALWAIANTMQSMADGTCAAKVHLSACDPGVGKSQTCIRFAEALVADASYRGCGMIVSAYTIAEVAALASALADVKDSLCVLTSDAVVNALGGADAQNGQILITTQNRLGRLTQNRPFASATAFHYQGEPRSVRVWDESLLPGTPVVVFADAVMGLASNLRWASTALVEALYAFGSMLATLTTGAPVDVPEFAPLETMPILNDPRDRDTVVALWSMSGRRVRVSRDGREGCAMLTYREELPDDLMPLLVLDASGRVRDTYTLWESHRDSLVRLPSAVRDYTPLTLNVWRRSGSKSGWASDSGVLVAGVVATIMTKPDERWLVVTHRASGIIGDPAKSISGKLPADVRANVAFTSWGRHCGVNDWAEVPNVILAGTLFYPNSHLAALHHACAAIPVEGGLVDADKVRVTERGEHRHLLVQALGRGQMRRSEGNQCQPMTGYIVASPRSGIEAELPAVFPGCKVQPWVPLGTKPTGKVKETLDWLRDAFAGGKTQIAFAEVQEAVGMTVKNFTQRVLKADSWNDGIKAIGAEVVVNGLHGEKLIRVRP